jgi:hypothetical protein
MKHVKLRLTEKEADMLVLAARSIEDEVDNIGLEPQEVQAYNRAMTKLREARIVAARSS